MTYNVFSGTLNPTQSITWERGTKPLPPAIGPGEGLAETD